MSRVSVGGVQEGRAQEAMDLTWFTSATVASHSLAITDILASHLAITANDDGTLSESDSFNYSSISWTAGKVQTGWDVAKGTAL